MSGIAVHVDFGEHVERESVLLLHSLLNFRIGARFLAGKLIAGESGNTESVSLVFFVQSFQLRVIRVGQTSVGCNIHHHHYFAFIFVFYLNELFIDVQGFELVDGRGRFRVSLFRPDDSQVEQERS